MTSKWTNDQADVKTDFDKLFAEKFAVVLLRGKNSFGDLIYSYVKITFANFKRMYEEMETKNTFVPSDFGEVVAAGTGEPSDEVKAEIAAQYPMMEQKPAGNGGGSAAAPIAKKAWDEY